MLLSENQNNAVVRKEDKATFLFRGGSRGVTRVTSPPCCFEIRPGQPHKGCSHIVVCSCDSWFFYFVVFSFLFLLHSVSFRFRAVD